MQTYRDPFAGLPAIRNHRAQEGSCQWLLTMGASGHPSPEPSWRRAFHELGADQNSQQSALQHDSGPTRGRVPQSWTPSQGLRPTGQAPEPAPISRRQAPGKPARESLFHVELNDAFEPHDARPYGLTSLRAVSETTASDNFVDGCPAHWAATRPDGSGRDHDMPASQSGSAQPHIWAPERTFHSTRPAAGNQHTGYAGQAALAHTGRVQHRGYHGSAGHSVLPAAQPAGLGQPPRHQEPADWRQPTQQASSSFDLDDPYSPRTKAGSRTSKDYARPPTMQPQKSDNKRHLPYQEGSSGCALLGGLQGGSLSRVVLRWCLLGSVLVFCGALAGPLLLPSPTVLCKRLGLMPAGW